MHLKFVLASLLITGTAFADEQPADPTAPPPGDGTGGGGEMGAEVGTAGADGTMAADATGVAFATKSAIDWSLLPNAGKIGAYAQLSILRFSFDDGMGGSVSGTGDGFGIGGAYGISDKLAVGAQYAVTLGLFDAESEFKGPLGIFGQFDIKTDEKLHLTGSAMFEFDLCGARDAMTGDCASAMGLTAGLGARYKLAPNMAVFTGAPYGPGPVGQHLSISLEEGNAASFSLPVGFMFQATPELNINAQTSLGTIAFNDAAGDSAFFGADFIPLSIGALFAVNEQVAVEGSLNLPDLKEAQFDILIFSVGARIRL